MDVILVMSKKGFSNHEDKLLVEYVKYNRILYDHGNTDFRNLNMKINFGVRLRNLLRKI